MCIRDREHGDIESLSENWLQLSLDIIYSGDTFTKWSCPRLVFQVVRKGEDIKYAALRIPHVIRSPKDTVNFNIQMPELQVNDMLKIYIWNNTRDEVVIQGVDIDVWK